MKLMRLALVSFAVISFLFLGFVHGQNENGQEEEVKTESNRIAVVVNKWLEPEIEANLNIYLNDLKNEGYEPILKIWDLENEPSPVALRGWLKGEYKDRESGSLQAAVLIGDLPIPYAKAIKRFLQITNSYIAEMYYMNLVGEDWEMADNYEFKDPYNIFWEILEYLNPMRGIEDWIKQRWVQAAPTIWTSRITTSKLTELFKSSESELVNAYLEKNHAYRTGKVVFSKQALVYSLPQMLKDDLALNQKAFDKAQHILSQQYVVKDYAPAYIKGFFEPLENEFYQILTWRRHGAKTHINLGIQDLNSTLLSNIPINVSTAFVFPMSCWIGHYVEPGYFGGTFTFNKSFFVLGMPTATLPVSGSPEVEMMNKFIAGSNLGTAFRDVITGTSFILYDDPQYAFRITINSRYIIGDGTLKLQSNEFVANESNSPKRYLEDNYPYSINQGLSDIINYVSVGYLEELAEKGADAGLIMLNAVRRENKGLVELLLLKYKPNLETKDPSTGFTALHEAVEKMQTPTGIEIIKLLLAAGARVDAKNNWGETAWKIAKIRGYNEEVLELLRVPEEKKEL